MAITKVEFGVSAARFQIHDSTADGAPDIDKVVEVPYDRSHKLPHLDLEKLQRPYETLFGPYAYWIPSRSEAVAFVVRHWWENNSGFAFSDETLGPFRVDEAVQEAIPHRIIVSEAQTLEVNAVLRNLYDRVLSSIGSQDFSLYQLSPRDFEAFVAELFAKQGYEVELTKTTHDGGYDVIAVKNEPGGLSLRLIIECKRNRPDRPVGIRVVRELWGVLCNPPSRFDRGIIATTSRLSRDARTQIASSYWRLHEMDHDALMNVAGFTKTQSGLWIP